MDKKHKKIIVTFGGPEWAWLRKRIRNCYELEKDLPLRVRCPEAKPEQQRMIAEVQGKSRPTATMSLHDLEELLQNAGLCESLREFVEIIDGPLVARASMKREETAAWEALADQSISASTWRRICKGDLKKGEGLVEQLQCFRKAVATFEGQPVQQIAAHLFGDSHSLDQTTPLYRLLVAEHQVEGRELWTKLKLLYDGVSSHALVWNLSFRADLSLAKALNTLCDAHQPYRILLRQMHEDLEPYPINNRLYVCENPIVLEEAANINWPHSLLCVEGNPSYACMMLLEKIAKGGSEIYYHGDFDWGGIRIANRVRSIKPAVFHPWQFSATDYKAKKGGHKLQGTPTIAEWDATLSELMQTQGRGYHEEQDMLQLWDV